MFAELAPGGIGRRIEQPGSALLWQVALAVLFAVAAASALIGMTLASRRVAFVLLALIVFALAFTFCGNRRLFFLWGLILTVPLAVSKSLFISAGAHMGGESELSIDLSDFFMVPLLVFILRDYARGWRPNLRFSPLLWWFGPMVLMGAVDIATGPSRTLAALQVIRMLKCYVLFFVIVNEVVRVKQFMHVFAALVIGITLEAGISLTQFLLKDSIGLKFLGEPDQKTIQYATETVYRGTVDAYRAAGLMLHPNLLAGFMAILLPICIAMMFSRLAPIFKLLVGGVVVMGLMSLMITLSRSGWLAFAAGFLVLFAFSMLHRKLSLRYMMARIVVIIGMVLALSLAGGYVMQRFTDSDPGAVKFRWDMMHTAFRMIADHPVLGLGLNTFDQHLPEYSDPPGAEAVTSAYGPDWPVVHDSYLITWTEQGTVGFVCLVGFYLCILWTGFKTSRYLIDDFIYALNLGATCGIIAIMVDGIASFFICEPQGVRVFWLVIGLIFALHYWTRANLPVRQPRRQAAQPRQALVPA